MAPLAPLPILEIVQAVWHLVYHREGSHHDLFLTWGWGANGVWRACVGLRVMAGDVLPAAWSGWHGAWHGRPTGPRIAVSWLGTAGNLQDVRFNAVPGAPGNWATVQFGEVVYVRSEGIVFCHAWWVGRQLTDGEDAGQWVVIAPVRRATVEIEGAIWV